MTCRTQSRPGGRLTRRALMAKAGALAALALAPVGPSGCVAGASAASRLLEALLGELAVPDPLAVGRSVVAATPGVLDAGDLWRELLAGLPLADAGALVATWRQRCRDDFAAGRRLVVDGWRLSLLEGKLCAAVALEQEPAG